MAIVPTQIHKHTYANVAPHTLIKLENLSMVFFYLTCQIKEYWSMYNIKKARNKVSHGSEDWIVERLLYHILPNI